MMRVAFIAGLAALVLAAGCLPARAPASQPPKAHFDVPPEWSGAEMAPETLGPGWVADFGDPHLEELVSEALEHNHDLAASAARVAQALESAHIAGADKLPQVNAGLSARRQRTNFIGLPIPGASGGVFSTTNSTYGVSLDVSWEIDLWGRLRATERAALAELGAAKAQDAGARLSLAGQTAKAWFTVLEAQKQLDLAKRTLSSYATSTKSVERRYQLGSAPPLDLRLSKSSVASARALLAQRERLLDASQRQLEALLGRYPAGQLAPNGALPALRASVPAGLPAELVARRPDLVVAERRLAAADARLVAARRSLYPRLSLTASGGTSTPELSDLLDDNLKVWNIAGNLLQPLFQGGRLRANVRLSEARLTELAEGFQSTLLGAYREVETALAAERHLAERAAALEDAAHQARAARALADEQYKSGLVGILAVLESQRRELQSESELLAAQRERLTQRVDLYLALGGGFTAVPEFVQASARPDGDEPR